MSRWTRNLGHLPREAVGKRVRVRLRRGDVPASDWPADGASGCRWSLLGDPHDIVEFEVVK